MAVDYQTLLTRFNALPAMRRSRQVGSGESSFMEEYDDANSRIIDGQEYILDPSSGALRTATGSIQSGGITTTIYNRDGTTTSSFEQGGRRSFGERLMQAALPALAIAGGGALAGSLLTGAAAAGGAAGGAGAAAGTAGTAAGAASLLTPTNALIGGTLLSTAMSAAQGRQQASAIRDATAANERIAAESAAEAERTRQDAERARQAVINAGGSQPGRSPEATAGARARNRAGASSTMLTGPGGVSTSSLSLGAPTLLGRLG